MDQTSQTGYVNGTLNLMILEAENLKKKDFNKMDPYVVVDFQGHKHQTQPCKKGHQFPKWDETLEIPMEGVSLKEPISFWVYDKEILMDNKIGKIELTLQGLADLCTTRDTCDLALETFSLLNKGKPAGVLRVKPWFKGSGWPGHSTATSTSMPSTIDQKGTPLETTTGTGTGTPIEKTEVFIRQQVEQPSVQQPPIQQPIQDFSTGGVQQQQYGGDAGLPGVDRELEQRLKDIELLDRTQPVGGFQQDVQGGVLQQGVQGGGLQDVQQGGVLGNQDLSQDARYQLDMHEKIQGGGISTERAHHQLEDAQRQELDMFEKNQGLGISTEKVHHQMADAQRQELDIFEKDQGLGVSQEKVHHQMTDAGRHEVDMYEKNQGGGISQEKVLHHEVNDV
jgi:hypothetical protein